MGIPVHATTAPSCQPAPSLLTAPSLRGTSPRERPLPVHAPRNPPRRRRPLMPVLLLLLLLLLVVTSTTHLASFLPVLTVILVSCLLCRRRTSRPAVTPTPSRLWTVHATTAQTLPTAQSTTQRPLFVHAPRPTLLKILQMLILLLNVPPSVTLRMLIIKVFAIPRRKRK